VITKVHNNAPFRVAKGKRSSGASDELFVECRQPTTDAARCGHGHSSILLRGAAGVVVFQPGGPRRALTLALSAGVIDRRPRNALQRIVVSARLFDSAGDVALQAANAAQGKGVMGEREQGRSDQQHCDRPKQRHWT
jgi:hypothetical protein